jgi:hypothetical protein
MSVSACEPGTVLTPENVNFVTVELRPYLADLLAREQTAWNEHLAPWSDPPEALVACLDGGIRSLARATTQRQQRASRGVQ